MATEDYTYEKLSRDFGGNKYLLVNVAAQRARQINDGVEVYVRAKSRHPLEVAFQEIAEDYIVHEVGAKPPEEEPEIFDDEILALDEMMSLESDVDAGEEEEEFDIEEFESDDEDVIDSEEIDVGMGEEEG
ncbi:MAG: DNA-directed RNA polymerase subunit omega [bacterium]